MSLSVITLNHEREDFIANQIPALAKQAQSCGATIEHLLINVETKGFPDQDYNNDNYTLVQYTIPMASDGRFPYARARNTGAERAKYEQLLFLDADCVPAEGFLEHYLESISHCSDGVVSGHAWYMRQGARLEDMSLQLQAQTQYYHPGLDIRAPQVAARTDSWEQFSSIHFACTQKVFNAIGGFDENFTGYSGEDSDFGQQLKAQKIPLFANKAEVYHQYHKPSGAPFGLIKEFIHNANYFASKWGFLPGRSWIETFKKEGLLTEEEGRLVYTDQ